MKALFLAHSFPRWLSDPVGSFVLRLAVALREQGIEVRVIAPSAEGLAMREEFDGIPVRRFRYAPSTSMETLAYSGTMRDRVGSSPVAAALMASLVGFDFLAAMSEAGDFAPDVVHAHWWFPGGLVASGVRSMRGVPSVVTMHGSDVRIARSSPRAGKLFRYVAQRSDRMTAVSAWLAREATAVAPSATPAVIPMPIVPGMFTPGVHATDDRLLFVGKLNEQKGIRHLLGALARTRHTASLDIVTGVGSDEGATRRLASELGVAARIRWHPLLQHDELAALYRAATVLVMPSIDEGLGLVAAEALLCGTPVVAFDSGGVPDIVHHGETGLLVPPGDAGALAGAIDDLLDRPDRGESLGRAGREFVMRTMSPDAVATKFRDVYLEARAARDRAR
ncbi:MAG: glycosyltransferase [Gemmatimonadota bacterium]|nr:glycosyltransferase [Gemmatimonadota bacterium]